METMKGTFEKPLYLVGSDRVLIDDVTQYGLHRKHIVRKGAMPDLTSWVYPAHAEVFVFMSENGIGHLWIFWKESKA